MSDARNDDDIPHGLEDKTEMATMFEGALKSNDVFLVIRVSLLDLHEDLRLFQTSFVPTAVLA